MQRKRGRCSRGVLPQPAAVAGAGGRPARIAPDRLGERPQIVNAGMPRFAMPEELVAGHVAATHVYSPAGSVEDAVKPAPQECFFLRLVLDATGLGALGPAQTAT
jgi:hypothetical protein